MVSRQSGLIGKILLGLLGVVAALLLFAYLQLVGIGGPELREGVASDVWTDTLIDDIPVALDVAPDGRIFVAMTGKFSQGAGDNRQQSFWLLDDRASNSIEDRRAYIQKWIDKGELTEQWFTEVFESVLLLRDKDGDGVGDTVKQFAEIRGVLDGVVAGVLAHGDDVLVTSIPHVWRFRDTDGDDVADEREILSTGYGLRTAFVGHDLHGLTVGPDGKIYFSVGDRGFNITTPDGRHIKPDMDYGRGGVFRMNPDGSELELFHQGLRNPQEIAFDNYGNLFTGDNNSDGGDKARIVYVVEGGDSGWTDGYQYQADDEYLRGPWNAEKLWHPYHENQPAWIVPPLALHTNGPSGMAFYPGIGLPERYDGHFFLSDYVFYAAGSNILSFAVEPRGAGFELVDVHRFASNELFIDQTFGYDGKMYAVSAGVFGGKKRIRTFYDPDQQGSATVEEVQRLFEQGFDTQSDERLLGLLAHADQRVRLNAQFELAARSRVDALNTVAIDPGKPEFARLHALWALGQIGANALRWQDFAAFDGELLAQAVKIAGDAGAEKLRAANRSLLDHDNARVRYFAAMTAGKLRDRAAVPALLQLGGRVAQNAVEASDPHLRHAVVWGLSQIGDRVAVKNAAADKNSAVRMTVLLTLRRWADAEIADFLDDTDPVIVAEAARAIYDLPLPDALPRLAALAAKPAVTTSADEQLSYALHRRIIHAAVRLGGDAGARLLLRYIGDGDNPAAMRRHALTALQNYTAPPPLDAVIGMYRPIEPRDESVVYAAIDDLMPALVKGDLGDEALAVAVHYNRVPLANAELLAMLERGDVSAANRLSAIQALTARDSAKTSGVLAQAAQLALDNQDPLLQAAGLRALAVADPEAAVARAVALASGEAPVPLRQSAIVLLGELGGERAEQWLLQALNRLATRSHDPGTGLEIIGAAEHLGSDRLAAALAGYRATLPPGDVVAARHTTLAGGDVVAGRNKFQTGGDCLRCHAVNGEGGNAGPDLAGVGAQYSAKYLLEAMVTPGSAIAPGFGSVSLELKDGTQLAGIMVGEDADTISLRAYSAHGEGGPTVLRKSDIKTQDGPVSGMPPMGLVMSHRDLRDVMAYLQSLR